MLSFLEKLHNILYSSDVAHLKIFLDLRLFISKNKEEENNSVS